MNQRWLNLFLLVFVVVVASAGVVVYQRVQAQRRYAQLLSGVASTNLETRRQSAHRLGAYSNQKREVIPALLPLLADGDLVVRESAARSLFRLHPAGDVWQDPQLVQPALPLLVSALRNDCNLVVNASVVVLTEIGEPAVAPLIASLNDENSRRGAERALAAIGRPAVTRLIKTALLEDPAVQHSAMSTLGSMGRNKIAPETVVPLLEALQTSTDPGVQASAARALGHVHVRTDEVVSALIEALRSENNRVRSAAANALSMLSSNDDEISQRLFQLIVNDAQLRPAATGILAQQGSFLNNSLGMIVSLARSHDDPLVRRSAIQLLSALAFIAGHYEMVPGHPEQVIRTLLEALDDQDSVCRSNAADGLSQFPNAASETVAAMAARVEVEPELRTLLSLVRALGRLGPAAESALPALESISSGAEARAIRIEAERPLARSGPAAECALPALWRVRSGAEARVLRIEAERAIDQIRLKDAEPQP